MRYVLFMIPFLLVGCVSLTTRIENEEKTACYCGVEFALSDIFLTQYRDTNTLYGISTTLLGFNLAPTTVTGLGIYGCQMLSEGNGGFVTGVSLVEALTGCQVALLGATANAKGVALAGVGNVCFANFRGVQAAFLFNCNMDVVETHLKGCQIACFNAITRLDGLQLGLLNYTEKGCGVQVGLLNFKKGSLPLPLLRVSFDDE